IGIRPLLARLVVGGGTASSQCTTSAIRPPDAIARRLVGRVCLDEVSPVTRWIGRASDATPGARHGSPQPLHELLLRNSTRPRAEGRAMSRHIQVSFPACRPVDALPQNEPVR